MAPPRRSSGGGEHCELTPPGTRGRREMNTFGDTSSQVHFCSETRRHSRPHTSSAVADGQVLDTAARACLYRTCHRKTRRRGPGQRRYPRTGAPRPRAAEAEAAAERLRRDPRAADRRATRRRRCCCCCCSAPTTLAPLLLLLLLPPRHAGRARRRRRAASGSRRAVSGLRRAASTSQPKRHGHTGSRRQFSPSSPHGRRSVRSGAAARWRHVLDCRVSG